MRGILYRGTYSHRIYLNESEDGGEERATRMELLVPDAELWFCWDFPIGVVQVMVADSFESLDLPIGETRLVHRQKIDEVVDVPYRVVREARRYLKKQEHIRAQRAAIQVATDRLTREAQYNEGRFQKSASILKKS